MEETKDIKNAVKEKYSKIAIGEITSCCSTDSCCGPSEYSAIGENYQQVDGYVEDADLNLGCGLPTQFAKITSGQTVLDLGSGAGNDCFIAMNETGPTGKVIGLDFSDEMVELARKNAHKINAENVKFISGDIESIPLDTNEIDVIVSNCVLNLVPNKHKAFAETFRVLKPGGHFSISDIVVKGELPDGFQEEAEEYVGCVAGAIPLGQYLSMLQETGFRDIEIQKLRAIDLPPALWRKYFSTEDQKHFLDEGSGIFSLSIFGQKPA